MPLGAEIISVQSQGGAICLWAKCRKDAQPSLREFVIVGMGHSFDDAGLRFIGTVQNNAFVWHIFERATDQPPAPVSGTGEAR